MRQTQKKQHIQQERLHVLATQHRTGKGKSNVEEAKTSAGIKGQRLNYCSTVAQKDGRIVCAAQEHHAHSSTAAKNRGEASPTRTPTHLAVHEEEPRHGVPGEGCVGAAAHLARHVLHDVFPQERLDVLRHVLACKRTFERDCRASTGRPARTGGGNKQWR